MTVMASLMATEIAEQPAALAATSASLRARRDELRRVVRDARRVVFFARGSSDSAATYGRYLVEIVAGLPSAMGAPSVATLYRARLDLRDTLVVLCSQSGRTEEITELGEWARSCGAVTVAVTNEPGSPLTQVVDCALVTAAGTERAVPATKSHTTCLLALAELTVALTDDVVLAGTLDRVPDEAQRLLDAGAPLAAVAAEALHDKPAFAVTGRGFTYPTALELALKIEETSLVPALGLSQADLEHGPQAVLGAATPLVVACAADGPTVPGLLAVAQRAAERGSPVCSLGGPPQLQELSAHALPGPQLPEPLAPVVAILPGQQLAERLARARGMDPDAPPGLNKVTRTSG